MGKETSRWKKPENGYKPLGKTNVQKELEKTGRREDAAQSMVLENQGRGEPQGRSGRIEVNGREKGEDCDGNAFVQSWAKSKEIK